MSSHASFSFDVYLLTANIHILPQDISVHPRDIVFQHVWHVRSTPTICTQACLLIRIVRCAHATPLQQILLLVEAAGAVSVTRASMVDSNLRTLCVCHVLQTPMAQPFFTRDTTLRYVSNSVVIACLDVPTQPSCILYMVMPRLARVW